MDNNTAKRNRNIIIGIIIAILFLLGSCGILHGLDLFKQDNSMVVTEDQSNDPSPLIYSPTEQKDDFIGAEEGEGEITYTLIRALDERGIYVDYFSLLNDKSTEIVIAPNAPAGVYELLIRATAAGDSNHKPVSREFTIKITVNKAAGSFDSVPTAIEGLEYNGSNQNLVNPGTSSTGTVYYKVDDGEWDTKIPQAKDAGTYTVYYKLVGDKNHTDIGEQSFTVTIACASVGNKPQSLTVVYDGKSHSINYTKPANVTQQGDATGTNAGTYSATFTPNDNYCWSDGSTSSVTATLTINKATLNKPAKTEVVKPYNGKEQTNDYDKPDGVSMTGSDRGTAVGTYEATYTPNDNYCWSDGTTSSIKVKLIINEKSVGDKPKDKIVTYNGKVQDNGYITPEGVEMSGIREATNAGVYEAFYKPKEYYCWSDGTTDTVIVKLTIKKLAVEVPTVTSDVYFEYDGKEHFITLSEYDENLITVTGLESHKDAGDYDVTLSLDYENCEWATETDKDKDVVYTWYIGKRSLFVPIVKSYYLYNGEPHTVTENDLYFFKENLMKISSSETGVDAGEYHTLIDLKDPDNYCWKDKTGGSGTRDIKWEICKAPNHVVIDRIQDICTPYSFEDTSIAFAGPESAYGEAHYKLKSARYKGSTKTVDCFSIEEGTTVPNIQMDGGTIANIYELIIGVHVEGDKNHTDYDCDIMVNLVVNIAKYKVEFYPGAEDVTGEMNSQYFVTTDLGWVLNRNKFERELYTFKNWYAENGEYSRTFEDGEYVNNREIYMLADENNVVKLYAQWEEIPKYDIVYIDLRPLMALNLNTIDYSSLSWGERIKLIADVAIALANTGYTSDSPVVYGEPYGDAIPAIGRSDVPGFEFAWYAASNGERVTSSTPATHVFDKSIIQSMEKLMPYIKPFIDGFIPEELADIVNIDDIMGIIENLLGDENKIILVSFGKAYSNTAYTVVHRVDNINTGEYEIFKEELRFGKTNSKIDINEIALEVEGFKLLEDKVEGDRYIKAGGSTIILNYNRIEYTVEFNSKGGSDVESQKVKFGGLAKEPEVPTFEDEQYRFVGWYLNGQKFEFDTKIKGDIVLEAKWELKELVDITVLSNNDKYGYTTGTGRYLADDSVEIEAIPYIDYRFVGWDDDGDGKPDNNSNPRTVVVEDEKTYTAIFDKIGTESLVYIEDITYYATPGETIDISDIFKLTYINPRTASIVTDGPISVELSKLKATLKVDAEANPGTYTAEVTVKPYVSLIHRTSKVTINVVVDIPKYTVSFDSNNGTDVADQYIEEGGYASETAAKTSRSGYTFVDWMCFDEESGVYVPFDFSTPIVEDIKLVAKWEKNLVALFKSNGAVVSRQEVTINDGYEVSDPGDLEPFDDKHEFGGWYIDDPESILEFPITIDRDTVINAKWIDTTVMVNITVKVNGKGKATLTGPDGITSTSGSFEIGTVLTLKATPNSGNKFAGWSDDGEDKMKETRTVVVTENGLTEYTANFEALSDKSLVKYDKKEYDLIRGETQSVKDDLYYLLIDDYKPNPGNGPVRFNKRDRIAYTYYDTVELEVSNDAEIRDYSIKVTVSRNWTGYIGGYNKNSEITYIVHVNAKVTFDSNGGSEVQYQAVRKDGKATRPEDPTRGNDVFAGWHVGSEEGELFDFNTPITDDITLVAKWTTIESVDVTIDMNDGSNPVIKSVVKGDKIDPITPVIRDGYSFAGWCIGSEEGELFDFNNPIEEELTLVAKWTKKQYIVYYDNNGSSYGSKNVLWNTGDLAPEGTPRTLNPLHVFTGWYIDSSCTVPYRGQKYAELAGYDDDVTSVTLYAGWYNRGLMHYTSKTSSVEGEHKDYTIKQDDDWYLVLSEFDIVGGPDADMFTMSLDGKSISINDNAKPGTYYVEVQTDWMAILRYLGVDIVVDFDDVIDLAEIFEKAGIPVPENINDILDEVLQNVLIEWTVEEKEEEEEQEDEQEEDPDALEGEAGRSAEGENDGEENPEEELPSADKPEEVDPDSQDGQGDQSNPDENPEENKQSGQQDGNGQEPAKEENKEEKPEEPSGENRGQSIPENSVNDVPPVTDLDNNKKEETGETNDGDVNGKEEQKEENPEVPSEPAAEE